jgi:hypothetical protein
VAGLIWSADLSRPNTQVRDALEKTAKDMGTAGRDNAYGYGLVQAKAALDYLSSIPPTPTLQVAVSTDKASYVHRETVLITFTVTDGLARVPGAAVHLDLRTAKGNRYSGNGTTDANGVVRFSYTVNSKRDGVGTYIVTGTATKSGYNPGTGTTTFMVTK